MSTQNQANRFRLATVFCLLSVVPFVAVRNLAAQGPPMHFRFSGGMPPGAIGRELARHREPLRGHIQSVRLLGPPGLLVSVASSGQFGTFEQVPRTVGLRIGNVYRFRISGIPGREGEEVFPTVEVIDRLHAPAGKEAQYPIPIDLTAEDLVLSLDGRSVTRVVYLEPTQNALPAISGWQRQSYFEVAPGEDPLRVADEMGRPMAILRMGSRVPKTSPPESTFLFGSPPVIEYSRNSTTTTKSITPIEHGVLDPKSTSQGTMSVFDWPTNNSSHQMPRIR